MVSLIKVSNSPEVINSSTIANVSSVLSSFTRGRPIPESKPAEIQIPVPKALDSVGNCSKVAIMSTLNKILSNPLVIIFTTY